MLTIYVEVELALEVDGDAVQFVPLHDPGIKSG